VKESATEFLFEPTNVKAERGLSHMERVRRFRDGSVVDHSQKVTKLTKVHGIPTRLTRRRCPADLIAAPGRDRK
jgi:hypothetical protein